MRPHPAVLVGLAVFALVFSSVGGRGEITDPGNPGYVNRIMSDFSTPTVSPGETLTFSFSINNPYKEDDMTGIVLTADIYKYATKDETRVVDDSFEHPPLIFGQSLEYTRDPFGLGVNSSTTISEERISFDIVTSHKTPHGGYYSQSAYFLRFNMTFNLENYGSNPVVLKSRGYFTDDQWAKLFSNASHQNELNVTYMRSLGVDGILPDSAFGLKTPIPVWPLALLGLATGGAAGLALYYFVLDNPGKYPYLEKRFYYLRGKLGELWRKLQHRGGK